MIYAKYDAAPDRWLGHITAMKHPRDSRHNLSKFRCQTLSILSLQNRTQIPEKNLDTHYRSRQKQQLVTDVTKVNQSHIGCKQHDQPGVNSFPSMMRILFLKNIKVLWYELGLRPSAAWNPFSPNHTACTIGEMLANEMVRETGGREKVGMGAVVES